MKTLKLKWYAENDKINNKESEQEFFVHFFSDFALQIGCEPTDFKDPLNVGNHKTIRQDFMKKILLNVKFK